MYACVFDVHSLSHFLAIETEITRYADDATYCTTDRQLIIMHVCRYHISHIVDNWNVRIHNY